jgi:hypothetical protein
MLQISLGKWFLLPINPYVEQNVQYKKRKTGKRVSYRVKYFMKEIDRPSATIQKLAAALKMAFGINSPKIRITMVAKESQQKFSKQSPTRPAIETY